MNEHIILICVVVGCIPYIVKRWQIRGGHALEIRALFWSLRYTHQRWTIHVPLIERLRHVIWMVIIHLREDNHAQK